MVKAGSSTGCAVRSGGVSKVSVIVPTCRRPQLLDAALSSLRAVEGPDAELELIVVDNADDRETEAVAGRFGARYLHCAVPGPGAPRNVGLLAATGTYIAFLDDDDVWLPGHLRPHVEAFAADPDLRMVVGQTLTCDFHLKPLFPAWPTLEAGRISMASVFCNFSVLGSLLVHRAVVDAGLRFREDVLVGEDWDWEVRVAERFPVAFVPVPCVALRTWPDGDVARERVTWARMGHFHRVLAPHLRGPGAWLRWQLVIRVYASRRGRYAWEFVRCAMAAADPATARRALWHALAASPPHLAWLMARHPAARRALGRAAARGR
jgi:glycosyltransferase involved in cell wall biosynthesis